MFILLNGRFHPAGEPLIHIDNRSFRYGDGLFETMKMKEGRLLLADLHFERLFNGLRMLAFEPPASFTPAYLTECISALCEKNGVTSLGRVRMMVFRGCGGLFDGVSAAPEWLLEVTPLKAGSLKARRPEIGVFYDARKVRDAFSALKSNNYLPYVMAALHARRQGLDECLVLNEEGRIVEAAAANVFIVTAGTIATPPLSEGCVAGVTRRYLLRLLQERGYAITEQPFAPADLREAEEVWLTNAGTGLRAVSRCGDTSYGDHLASEVGTLLEEQLERDYLR